MTLSKTPGNASLKYMTAGIWPSGLRRWFYHDEANICVMVVLPLDCDDQWTIAKRTRDRAWSDFFCANSCKKTLHHGTVSSQHAIATSYGSVVMSYTKGTRTVS